MGKLDYDLLGIGIKTVGNEFHEALSDGGVHIDTQRFEHADMDAHAQFLFSFQSTSS